MTISSRAGSVTSTSEHQQDEATLLCYDFTLLNISSPQAPSPQHTAPAWVTRYTNWDMFITRELRLAPGVLVAGLAWLLVEM